MCQYNVSLLSWISTSSITDQSLKGVWIFLELSRFFAVSIGPAYNRPISKMDLNLPWTLRAFAFAVSISPAYNRSSLSCKPEAILSSIYVFDTCDLSFQIVKDLSFMFKVASKFLQNKDPPPSWPCYQCALFHQFWEKVLLQQLWLYQMWSKFWITQNSDRGIWAKRTPRCAHNPVFKDLREGVKKMIFWGLCPKLWVSGGQKS